MNTYGVLIVDDSAVMRKQISAIIDESEHFYVIGKARNGVDALEKIAYMQPQLVLLDSDMPTMNGWEALRLQMAKQPVPIVLLGSAQEEQQKALQLGAIDFIEKPRFLEAVHDVLARFTEQTARHMPAPMEKERPSPSEIVSEHATVAELAKQLVVIGSSTGGPSALQRILSAFSTSLRVPIIIVQHMPEGFTKPLAQRFNDLCDFPVKEAEHNEILCNGSVYIAPAGVQTLVKKTADGQYKITLQKTTTYDTLYKPSIDVTLQSVAPHAKNQLLTVILTGMGDDGLHGCIDVKHNGGTIFVEAEETCVVYGMPKVVMNAGIAHQQLAIQHMAAAIEQHINS